MRTLLVVDDDERLRSLLAEYLGERGFQVETAPTGEAGLARVRQGGIDLVVLDVMLPGQDGFAVCREIRTTSKLPVLMLTARGDETDRIVGLELGADDYLPKPFNPRELLARVQAILRRAEATPAEPSVARAGPVEVDLDRRVVRVNGAEIELTTTEFEILRTLVLNAGKIIPRDKVMSMARGEEWAAFERSVDVHISHLRKKLGDDPKTPALIKTVRGVGYTMPKGNA
jgi:two-component system phosphate regulon response regulator OmpR